MELQVPKILVDYKGAAPRKARLGDRVTIELGVANWTEDQIIDGFKIRMTPDLPFLLVGTRVDKQPIPLRYYKDKTDCIFVVDFP
ncbi:MAG: hypothetical protein C4332_12625, partial [Meiothermus sp.]